MQAGQSDRGWLAAARRAACGLCLLLEQLALTLPSSDTLCKQDTCVRGTLPRPLQQRPLRSAGELPASVHCTVWQTLCNTDLQLCLLWPGIQPLPHRLLPYQAAPGSVAAHAQPCMPARSRDPAVWCRNRRRPSQSLRGLRAAALLCLALPAQAAPSSQDAACLSGQAAPQQVIALIHPAPRTRWCSMPQEGQCAWE